MRRFRAGEDLDHVQLYEAGVGVAKVAALFGVSRGSMEYNLRLAGVLKRPKGWQLGDRGARPPVLAREVIAQAAGMIDRRSEIAWYRQLAGALRAKIVSGALPPGSQLPGECELTAACSVGRDVVRQAFALLRGEGLLVIERGRRAMVRERADIEIVSAGAGAVVSARMPTPDECEQLGVPDGIPVLVVCTGGTAVVYSAHSTQVRYTDTQ